MARALAVLGICGVDAVVQGFNEGFTVPLLTLTASPSARASAAKSHLFQGHAFAPAVHTQ
jgi:hypothetical protein